MEYAQVKSWKFSSWFNPIAAKLFTFTLGFVQNTSCTLNSAAASGWKPNVMSTRSEPSETSQWWFFAAIVQT